MNLCFLIGKIVSEIEFKFILNSKNIAVTIFEIQLDKQSMITVKAYNEMADWCYQKLVKEDVVAIKGNLNSKMEIVIHNLNLL